MKKYIIAFILFCLCLICIEDAYADAFSPYWGYHIDYFDRGQFYKCDSTDCSTTLTTVSQYGYFKSSTTSSNSISYPGYLTGSTSLNSNGSLFRSSLNNTRFLTTHAYYLTAYVCHSSSSYSVKPIDVYTGGSASISTLTYPVDNYIDPTYQKVSNKPFEIIGDEEETLPGDHYATCNSLRYYFKPTSGGTYLGIRFMPTTNFTSPLYLVGYELTDLGDVTLLSKEDVASIIEDSNLATATSVEQIQVSQEQIKTEIQGMQDKQDVTNEKLDEVNDNLTNDDTSDATDSAGGFFEGFTTDTFGLTSIITAPLNLIKSITSKTCTPLNLQIPFVNKNMQLPCMTTIYTNYFGSFLTIYQTITFGIISYWVCIRIFALVKDFKNPDHDEIEVMDL